MRDSTRTPWTHLRIVRGQTACNSGASASNRTRTAKHPPMCACGRDAERQCSTASQTDSVGTEQCTDLWWWWSPLRLTRRKESEHLGDVSLSGIEHRYPSSEDRADDRLAGQLQRTREVDSQRGAAGRRRKMRGKRGSGGGGVGGGGRWRRRRGGCGCGSRSGCGCGRVSLCAGLESQRRPRLHSRVHGRSGTFASLR